MGVMHCPFKEFEDASCQIMKRIDELPHYLPPMHGFLRDNGVDDDAKKMFLDLDYSLMQKVVTQGPLEGHNASAVLMARMKRVKMQQSVSYQQQQQHQQQQAHQQQYHRNWTDGQ